jgi:hypothetical protein
MMLYKVYGTVLGSSIHVPELPAIEGQPPAWTFRVGHGGKIDTGAVRWTRHWTLPSGVIWLSIAQSADHYLLRFPDIADFHIQLERAEITCNHDRTVPIETIQHLFLDQVLPLVLSRTGTLLMHASAVDVPTGIVAFAGVTGMGKSTLATSFAANGYPLVTDDCLRVEFNDDELFGTPGYPSSRLWGDAIDGLFEEQPRLSEVAHYTDKKRLSFHNTRLSFCDETLPVKRIFVLLPHEAGEDVEGVVIARMSLREAFMALATYIFKLDVSDRDLLATDFDRLGRIAQMSLCYRLSFPHDFDRLPAVRRAILSHLHSE